MKNIVEKFKNFRGNGFLAIQYAFVLILPVLYTMRSHSVGYLFMAAYEVVMIILLTETGMRISKRITWILKSLALLFLNFQYAVLYFGNTFLSVSMVENLDSLQDISGKFYIYIPLLILVILLSFLPVCRIRMNFAAYGSRILSRFTESGSHMYGRKELMDRILAAALVLGLFLSAFFQTGDIATVYSPYGAFAQMIEQKREQDAMRAEILAMMEQKEAEEREAEALREQEAAEYAAARQAQIREKIDSYKDTEFYREEVTDYVSRPDTLAEKPNVILVFMEGTSQIMVEDERNLMPNLRALEENSIFFDNYFNHTFATYMGLSGQLYSGYQQSNMDPNYLVSLQDILRENGYRTLLINTEPKNTDFSAYLAGFDFDEVITSDKLNGAVDSISDKDAYSLLYDTAVDAAGEEPFFLCIYSFGTHVNTESPDEKYEDGKNATLNRTVNADKWLGEFVEKFNSSGLAENTVLVVTADHAAYKDADYAKAFSGRGVTSLDRIPLLLYHQGIEPQVIDAWGRNTLDLTPTILDYLDLTDGNCFLGDSLFKPMNVEHETENLYEMTYFSEGIYYITRRGIIAPQPYNEIDVFKERQMDYFKWKLGGAQTEDPETTQEADQ